MRMSVCVKSANGHGRAIKLNVGRFVGEGSSAYAYQNLDLPGHLLIMDVGAEPRMLLCKLYAQGKNRAWQKHLPAVRYIGDLAPDNNFGKRCVFSVPRYKCMNHYTGHARTQYEILKSLVADAWDYADVTRFKPPADRIEFLTYLKANIRTCELDRNLVEMLLILFRKCIEQQNYAFTFEVQFRDVGLGAENQLVLFDPIFRPHF